MKKLYILILILSAILFSNISNANAKLKTHCVFMTYNYTLLGTQHQGSGFYCIEWFWRTGQQPESGEQTNATLGSSESNFDPGQEVEFLKDQFIKTTYENITINLKLPKGKYTVNDEGNIRCIAIIVE